MKRLIFLRNLSIVIIIISIILGMCYGYYSSTIGGRVSKGFSEDGKYFIGTDNSVVEVDLPTWKIANIFEIIYHIFFVINIISILFLAVYYLFLKE